MFVLQNMYWYVGSYDHTVRLFDTRCNSSVLRIDHGSPVESVVMFPGGGIVASAGCFVLIAVSCCIHSYIQSVINYSLLLQYSSISQSINVMFNMRLLCDGKPA